MLTATRPKREFETNTSLPSRKKQNTLHTHVPILHPTYVAVPHQLFHDTSMNTVLPPTNLQDTIEFHPGLMRRFMNIQ